MARIDTLMSRTFLLDIRNNETIDLEQREPGLISCNRNILVKSTPHRYIVGALIRTSRQTLYTRARAAQCTLFESDPYRKTGRRRGVRPDGLGKNTNRGLSRLSRECCREA